MAAPPEGPAGSPVRSAGLYGPDDQEPTAAAELHITLVPNGQPGALPGDPQHGEGRPGARVLARSQRPAGGSHSRLSALAVLIGAPFGVMALSLPVTWDDHRNRAGSRGPDCRGAASRHARAARGISSAWGRANRRCPSPS